MRVVRKATSAINPGSPDVTISANDDGARFANIPLGTPGPAVDTRLFGLLNTVIVDGDIDGTVQIQTSEDGTDWVDLCVFQFPGHKTLEITTRYVRANHVNNALGTTPTVALGAINDETSQSEIDTSVDVAQNEAIERIQSALGGSFQLVLTSPASPVSVTAATLNAAAAGEYSVPFYVELQTVEGARHDWFERDAKVGAALQTEAEIIPTENVVDVDVGVPTVADTEFVVGQMQALVVLDTDAGATKTYAPGDSVAVEVKVAPGGELLGYPVASVTLTIDVT
jgi:hypothetical protein